MHSELDSVEKIEFLKERNQTRKTMARLLLLATAALLCAFTVKAVSSMSIHDFGPGMVLYNVHNRGDNTMDTYASSDIVLHIRYHGSTNYVVLNTRINNRWLPRIPNNFRFSSAVEKITNVVEVKDTGFDIYVNGRHQFYPHRIDVTRTNWIHTFGGNIVQFSMGKVLREFSIGKVIYIRATAPSSGDFRIDLLPKLPSSMDCQWEKISMVLHAQFDAVPEVVSRNTYGPTCGRLELGEDEGGMPFEPNTPFEVVIVAQQFGFEIGVNGTHFATYEYRMPLAKDMTVMLTGVPSIETIQYY